jgi:glycosyltransferase involved in cell wall biosynthesis
MNNLLQDRLFTAMETFRNATLLRPRDVLNFVNMLLAMPRSLPARSPGPHPAQMALSIFSQMKVSYLPGLQQAGAPAIDDAGREALRHTQEPTVALFVDAPEHLSGVALTLQSWSEEAARQGRPLFLHMAGSELRKPGCKSFPKVGTLRFRSYEGLDVPVPDVKAVSAYMRGHPFDVAHLSTPGPMGMLGMRLARDAGVPVCGTYHTDFPRYVRELTGSAELEARTWDFMRWFYGQMDLVAAPSQATRNDLIAHGLDPARIQVVGRGVEQQAFSPEHRDPELRRAWGVADNETVLLYVGRVSREKNLPLLTEAYRDLHASGSSVRLVVVGDGPYAPEMRASLASTPAVFPGVLKGQDLSAAFASADLFVFPSETDTFGRVILEAQASGLPVLVSDKGGPRDAMLPERSGRIVPAVTPDRFREAMADLCADRARLAAWSRQAREHARHFTPEASFNAFWNLHRSVLQEAYVTT